MACEAQLSRAVQSHNGLAGPRFFVGNTWILLQWSEGNHKETWDKYGRNMERWGFDSMDFTIQLTFESMVPFLQQTLQISGMDPEIQQALLMQLALGVLCLMHFVHHHTAPPESFES